MVVAVMKSKYHRKMIVKQEVRVVVSNLVPRLRRLCGAQCVHIYHYQVNVVKK